MKKLTFALAGLLLASLAGTVMAVEPPKFDIQPGFTITPDANAPAPVETADPLWFACRVTVDYGTHGESGSGTPIGCEGGKTTILTNAHVVPKDAKDRPIKVHNQGRTFTARWVDGSEVKKTGPNTIEVLGPDLALLEIDAEIGHVELADEAPAKSAQVWQFGFGGQPDGHGPTIKYGQVIDNKLSRPTLMTNLWSQSGDSGSGIFNTNGELCGVTWGGEEIKDVYGTVVQKEHCAVPLGTVKGFLGRPFLSKLFPRLAARAEAKRAAKAAKAALAAPPGVDRKGPVDPKYAKPVKPSDPPKATGPGKPPVAAPAAPVAPVGSGIPPAPPGAGWQWDPVKKTWWKWTNPPVQGPAPPTLPPAAPGFVITPDQPGCVGGSCPVPSKPERRGIFRRW